MEGRWSQSYLRKSMASIVLEAGVFARARPADSRRHLLSDNQYSMDLSSLRIHPASPHFSLYCSCRMRPEVFALSSPSE